MRKFEDPEMAAIAGKKSSRAGVPNKTSVNIRESFKLLVENNLEQLQMDLDALKPIDRLRIIMEMAKFVIPQLQSVSLDDLRENEMRGFSVITVRLKGGNGGGNGKVIDETNNGKEGSNDDNDDN